MKTDTIKISFAASLLFHGIVIYTFASHFSSVKDTVMNITPIEILNIEDKNPSEQIENKMEDTPPPLPEKPIQEIKEEIPPQVEPVKAEINNIVEAPSLLAPTEQEIIKEAAIESPPLIEEAFENPAEETILAESTALSSNNKADSSETLSLQGKPQLASGEAIITEPIKSASSKFGVAGGTGSGNGEEMSMFRAMVRTKIERSKFYPRWARERGFEGVVGVRFTLLPDGGVTDVKVVRPCHCEVLNKAACEAIMKAAPFNPRPIEVADKEMAMEIDISYRLD